MTKIVFVLLSVVLATAFATTSDSIIQEEWNLFKFRYGKIYASPEEESERMKIFLQNKQEVAEHNLKYLSGQVTYEVAINKFSDMTSEEVNEIYNGFNKANRDKALPGEEPELPELEGDMFVAPYTTDLPEYVNWVEKGALAPVRDQGKCGSCYAFAGLAAMESHYYLKHKEMPSLSVQNVIDCSSDFGNAGCDGGLAFYVYDYIRFNKGVNNETVYPYEARTRMCRYKKDAVAAQLRSYVRVKPNSVADLKKALLNGPVSASMDASPASFKRYKKGVYKDPACSSTRLNHAVVVVGYGTDEESDEDYWLVRNSWGTDWGDEGYFKVAVKNNTCGFLNRPLFPKVM